jgi:hypothetical protein
MSKTQDTPNSKQKPKLDSVPCPYVEHQHFEDTELLCSIQKCNSCPMRFQYFQEDFDGQIGGLK